MSPALYRTHSQTMEYFILSKRLDSLPEMERLVFVSVENKG